MQGVRFFCCVVGCVLSLFFPVLLLADGIEEANLYHKHSLVQWEVALGITEFLPIQETEHLLDIGCGDGKITAYLASKVPQGSVLGVDVSEEMVAFASSSYPQSVFSNLLFQQMDAAHLCFSESFDRIVSFSALHWVVEQERALEGMYMA